MSALWSSIIKRMLNLIDFFYFQLRTTNHMQENIIGYPPGFLGKEKYIW